MKVGVIGTGFGRRVVAAVFDATPGCTVVEVVSARDEDAVRTLVQRSDVDLVSVHSPPYLHATHVRLALAAERAVLCDKPFALDADEAASLEVEARDAGVVALCNFEFRYAPARTMLRELVRTGALGRIEHVQSMHCSAGSRVPLRPFGWLFDRALGGGWVGAWGSHAVDQLRWMFATEVEAVDAVRRIDVASRPDADGVAHACTAEDGFSASMVLANGVTVAIDSGFAAIANAPARFTVFGTEGVAELVADEHVTLRRGDGTRETFDVPADAGPASDRHLEPMRRFAEVVRDAVHSGEIAGGVPTFADGRACDTVLDQLRAAPLANDLVSGD